MGKPPAVSSCGGEVRPKRHAGSRELGGERRCPGGSWSYPWRVRNGGEARRGRRWPESVAGAVLARRGTASMQAARGFSLRFLARGRGEGHGGACEVAGWSRRGSKRRGRARRPWPVSVRLGFGCGGEWGSEAEGELARGCVGSVSRGSWPWSAGRRALGALGTAPFLLARHGHG